MEVLDEFKTFVHVDAYFFCSHRLFFGTLLLDSKMIAYAWVVSLKNMLHGTFRNRLSKTKISHGILRKMSSCLIAPLIFNILERFSADLELKKLFV